MYAFDVTFIMRSYWIDLCKYPTAVVALREPPATNLSYAIVSSFLHNIWLKFLHRQLQPFVKASQPYIFCKAGTKPQFPVCQTLFSYYLL